MKIKMLNASAPLRINGENNQTIKFYTFGCKVNQYETQAMREQFAAAGFDELSERGNPRFCIVNTCTVTQKADSGSLSLIRRLRRENPGVALIVTGCLAELDEHKIRSAAADCLIIKNRDKGHILERIFRFRDYPVVFSSTACVEPVPQAGAGISYFKDHTRAFLKIQDGCNNFCSYCKVPLVRGQSRSRALNAVLRDAQSLVKNGIKEIVLCGICLGAYGKDLHPRFSLNDVIKALEEVEGLLRIRLSSIESTDVSDALIEKMAESRKLCPYLHIPVQSGDDTILKKMNRRCTRSAYADLINKIKSRIPNVAITTDVLVGFPGETDDNFRSTAELIKEMAPLKTHIFPYSARKGTFAGDNYKQALSPDVIKERISLLDGIAADCALEYKKRFLGKVREVLIEGRSKDNPGYWQGHTDNYMKVIVKSDLELANKIVNLRLKRLVKDCILAE